MNSFSINNRRYLGNKFKLLGFIKEIVDKECKEKISSVFDVFAGTGAVASAFIDKKLITNDILYSNYLAHLTWFSGEEFDVAKLRRIIKDYNESDVQEDNYMSINFSDTYFSQLTCRKIGYIRENIEQLYQDKEINERERAILVTSLLYAMDRIANTCGHYDAYRKNVVYNESLVLGLPKIERNSGINSCYNMDSNELAKNIKVDLAYIDPPYNSRQYCDTYHLLENVAMWQKPSVVGVAKKMDRKGLKSDYCTNHATQAFEDLIENLNAKYIVLSYNNTGVSSHDRSNARISDEDILRILRKKGHVKIFSKHYKAFTTGKSNNESNKERLFFCDCTKTKIASPLNYTGGKFKLLKQLQPLLPGHSDVFVDLFCGGGNVGVNQLANTHIYNDNNDSLIGLYKTLFKLSEQTIFNHVFEIINKYGLTLVSKNGYEYYNCHGADGLAYYNKERFFKLREDFNRLNKKDNMYYLMLYVLIVYGFNNQIRFNSKGEFNLPVGKRDFNEKMQIKLSQFLDRLKGQNCEFLCQEFDEVDIPENSFVYADPPYLITVATYNEKNAWNAEHEKRLLNFLDQLDDRGIKFALSNVLEHKGKVNSILENWLTDNKKRYNINRLNYNYNNSNYQTKDRKSGSVEVLITNY